MVALLEFEAQKLYYTFRGCLVSSSCNTCVLLIWPVFLDCLLALQCTVYTSSCLYIWKRPDKFPILQIFRILFQRLQSAKTTKYVGGLLSFLSWLIYSKGVNYVEQGMNVVQPGLFRILIEQVWLPNMTTVKAYKKKMLVTASTQVSSLYHSFFNITNWDILHQLHPSFGCSYRSTHAYSVEHIYINLLDCLLRSIH